MEKRKDINLDVLTGVINFEVQRKNQHMGSSYYVWFLQNHAKMFEIFPPGFWCWAFFWPIFSYQPIMGCPERQHWMGFCSFKWTPHVNQVYGENEYSTIREDWGRNMNFCLPFSHSLRSRHHWRNEGQQIHFWFEGYYRISSWMCTKVYCYPNKTGFFVFLDILVRISLWPVENLRLRCHNGIGQVRCPFNSC